MSGFKKVKFYHYKEDGKFGITFKHNGQMYELQCTDLIDDSFAFDFVRCIKDGARDIWDYENKIFDNVIGTRRIPHSMKFNKCRRVISEGKIK